MVNKDLDSDYKEIVKGLAKLSEIDYYRQQKDAAKNLGVSITALDRLVKQARSQLFNTDARKIFPDIEPWHENVDGKTLLDALEHVINRFIAFPSINEAKAITLYIIYTYCYDIFDYSPILNISSPEKRCGKSTLLSVLKRIVNRPLIAASISSAAVFRTIEKFKPTLILDEADTFLVNNEEMRGVINSGHERESAYVVRCVGDQHETVCFNTWCPKIIAGIGRLPGTIEDRSIIIQLRRKLGSESKEKLRDVPKTVVQQLAQKCLRFAMDNTECLEKIIPPVPKTLNDRSADNWAPLITIAKLGGDEWLKAAMDAAIQLSGIKQESISVGVELLQDIKNIFDREKLDRLSTSALLNMLCAEAEAPWATYNQGKPLSARQLASKLKSYKIRSRDMRVPPYNNSLKGYLVSDFSESFARYLPYLPALPQGEVLSATTRQALSDGL